MVKRILVLIFWLLAASTAQANTQQDTVFILKKEQLTESEWLRLPPITKWKFKKGSEPGWAAPELDDRDWIQMDSATIASLTYDENGEFEGWFRFRFKFQPDFEAYPFFLNSTNSCCPGDLSGRQAGCFFWKYRFGIRFISEEHGRNGSPFPGTRAGVYHGYSFL